MEIITGSNKDVRKLIERAYQELGSCDDITKRYALVDYLYQLHELERALGVDGSYLDEVAVLGSKKNARKYNLYIDSLFTRLDEEFIKFKEKHHEHFDAMLSINDEGLKDVCDVSFVDAYEEITKEEFFEYLYEFLSSYKLEGLFDRIVSDKRFFDRPFNEDEMYAGSVLYDPVLNKSNVVLCGRQYNMPYLLTIGHEFGHVFDLDLLYSDDYSRYLKYSYSSVYGEVLSITFEKLFYDFLFKKKYHIDDVKEIYSEFSFENKNYVLDTYLLSLLSDGLIRNLDFLSRKKILREVKSSFERIDEIKLHLEGRKLDTWKTPLYAYGDFMSSILKDSIQQDGFDNELMRKFLSIRDHVFNPDEVESIGFNIDEYGKVYKKDVSRLKK